MAYTWMMFVSVAKNHLGVWRAGGRVVSTGDRGQSKFSLAYFHLAAALAQLGRLDEAHSAVKAGLALDPTYTSPAPAPAWTASDDPTYLAGMERILGGMRKAGVPEQ